MIHQSRNEQMKDRWLDIHGRSKKSKSFHVGELVKDNQKVKQPHHPAVKVFCT